MDKRFFMNVGKITTENKLGFYGFADESHKRNPTKNYVLSKSIKLIGENESSMGGGD